MSYFVRKCHERHRLLSAGSLIKSLIDRVVVSDFQIIFRVKIHINDVFLFFKNYFWHQYIKTIQNIQIILNFNNKKKFKIFRNAAAAAFPNIALVHPQFAEELEQRVKEKVISLSFFVFNQDIFPLLYVTKKISV
jgi:hypothetical protein